MAERSNSAGPALAAVPPAPAHIPQPRTQNQIISDTTESYINEILAAPATPPAAKIENELIRKVNAELGIENAGKRGAEKFMPLKQLTFSQVARILIALHRVVRIAPGTSGTDRDYDLLAIYEDSGDDEGIYITSEDQIRGIARRYNRELTINGSKEIFAVLREEAPRVQRCSDRDLIAVNNGLFDYRTKTLGPFNPDQVFIAKSRVDYVPTATSPVISTPDGDAWEVEEWVRSLSDDPEIVDLLWEIMGAIVRPHVRWNKSAWFYSMQGNNGKGTLLALMRNLVGEGAYASIPIADFGKDFLLEPLVRASAILVDENDVGTYIDRAANLKAIVTNDVISINRKHKMPIAYQFWGFMVQCLNEFPQIKDKSESFYRRQLFVPFEKSFKGIERKYIKNDYLRRDDVLQYVLHRVLHMDYYELSEPEATRGVLDEYKEYNDPVRAFWTEVSPRFAWDLLPFQFLYDLYKGWFAQMNPSGKVLGRSKFLIELDAIVAEDPDWFSQGRNTKTRSAGRMDGPEPMIAQFSVEAWKSTTYNGPDPARTSMPALAQNYRGYLRLGNTAANDDDKDTP